MSTVYFYITNKIHTLDLSGPLQVFQEAKDCGLDYSLTFISDAPTVTSSAGLQFSSLQSFMETTPGQKDIIFIPGFDTALLDTYPIHHDFFDWLQRAQTNGVTICSVCTGAFLLAQAGILDHQECTTHWQLTDRLQEKYPLLRVQQGKLFVSSNKVHTSAGVATGIDLALFLIEKRHDELTAIKIAKELAVYIRRNGSDEQVSIFLKFRDHQDQKIHIVQDWIIHNLDKGVNIDHLAELVLMSKRNLSRVFKKKTGITIVEYRTKLRVEKAKNLQQHSGYKLEHIASLCGFKSTKQLRQILT